MATWLLVQLTGPLGGNQSGTCGFPHKGLVMGKKFLCHGEVIVGEINFENKISFVISTVPGDFITLLGAMTSAGTVMTMSGLHTGLAGL